MLLCIACIDRIIPIYLSHRYLADAAFLIYQVWQDLQSRAMASNAADVPASAKAFTNLGLSQRLQLASTRIET